MDYVNVVQEQTELVQILSRLGWGNGKNYVFEDISAVI